MVRIQVMQVKCSMSELDGSSLMYKTVRGSGGQLGENSNITEWDHFFFFAMVSLKTEK